MSESPLKDRVALVTGAARGIGRATVMRLAQAGAIPVVNFLTSEDKAAQTLRELHMVASRAVAIAADVRRPDQVQAMVEKVLKTFGRIDILVNNAGIVRDGFLHKLDTSRWEEVIETNLTGAFHVTRSVLPSMREMKSGRIVNIASVVAFSGNLGQTGYAASKAGLLGFTRSLALENAALGIRVNAVAPGFIETAMLETVPVPRREEIRTHIPVGRFGRAEDVAEAVAFLVGPESDYVTGQVIHVNGGLYL